MLKRVHTRDSFVFQAMKDPASYIGFYYWFCYTKDREFPASFSAERKTYTC